MISFGEAIKRFYKRYFDFQGRSQRSEYWWFMLYFYATLILLALPLFMGGMDFETEETTMLGNISLIAIVFFFLGHVIGMIAIAVRRFHDLGQTGWLVLVFGILGAIPLIGTLVSLGQIIWFCFPGTSGPNKYGPDPIGGSEEQIVETFL